MSLLKKIFLFMIIVFSFSVCHADWDESTPAGTEAKSLGDDRIRELKTDLRESLQYLGNTSYFPGADSSSPRYIPTISTVTTSERPTGNGAPWGRVIINISSTTLEQVNASGVWSDLDVVKSSSIFPVDLSTGVAGNGLTGGGGTTTELSVNVDNATLQISTDMVNIKPGGVVAGLLANNSVATSNIQNGAVTVDKFASGSSARLHARQESGGSNITGDGTTYVLRLSSENFDSDGAFSVSTFTAQSAGYYMFMVNLDIQNMSVASSESFSFWFAGTHTYASDCDDTDARFSGTSDFLVQYDFNFTCLTYVQSGDTFIPSLMADGGAKTVDLASAYLYILKIP